MTTDPKDEPDTTFSLWVMTHGPPGFPSRGPKSGACRDWPPEFLRIRGTARAQVLEQAQKAEGAR